MAPAGNSAGSSPAIPTQGLARLRGLARVFPLEQSDPDTFYRTVAHDTMAQIAQYTDVSGQLVLDIGGGGGYFSEAFGARGAQCILVEPDATDGAAPAPLDPDNLTSEERHRIAIWPGRLAPGVTLAGDGYQLPFPDGVADLTFSSNVLEHVADPERLVREMIRVTRPGGLLYVSFTVWWSPWGGHETAPWHLLGGARAARRYEAKTGRPPKNLYGTSMFACHVGPTLKMVDRLHDDVVVVKALPRYYPPWLYWVIRVPVLRELVTWNLLLILRRREPDCADPGQQ